MFCLIIVQIVFICCEFSSLYSGIMIIFVILYFCVILRDLLIFIGIYLILSCNLIINCFVFTLFASGKYFVVEACYKHLINISN